MKKSFLILLFTLSFSIPCMNSNHNWNRKEEDQKAFIWYLKQKYLPNDWSWVKSYQEKMKDMYNLK